MALGIILAMARQSPSRWPRRNRHYGRCRADAHALKWAQGNITTVPSLCGQRRRLGRGPDHAIIAKTQPILFTAGRLISLIGSGIQMIALPLYILDLTGSGNADGRLRHVEHGARPAGLPARRRAGRPAEPQAHRGLHRLRPGGSDPHPCLAGVRRPDGRGRPLCLPGLRLDPGQPLQRRHRGHAAGSGRGGGLCAGQRRQERGGQPFHDRGTRSGRRHLRGLWREDGLPAQWGLVPRLGRLRAAHRLPGRDQERRPG